MFNLNIFQIFKLKYLGFGSLRAHNSAFLLSAPVSDPGSEAEMLLLCPDLFFWDSKRRLWTAESLFQLQFQSIKALGEIVNHAISFENEERREEMLDVKKCLLRGRNVTLCAQSSEKIILLCAKDGVFIVSTSRWSER